MRFNLLDRIIELQPGKCIRAVTTLSPEEDYLRDHFPLFPVMPGVLMLEAMFQASAWLVRKSENFAHSTVVLKAARNVNYANFVEPGQTLTVTADLVKQDEHTTTIKAQGSIGEGDVLKDAVKARLILERFNLAQRYPSRSATDAYLRRRMREMFEQLFQSTSSLEPIT